MGVLCAYAYRNHGPQRPDPFADEEQEEYDSEFMEENVDEETTDKNEKLSDDDQQ